MRTTKIAIALLVLGASLAGSSQALGAALPAWKLSVSSQPTNFTPGCGRQPLLRPRVHDHRHQHRRQGHDRTGDDHRHPAGGPAPA